MTTHTFDRRTHTVPTINRKKAQPILKALGVSLCTGVDDASYADTYWFEWPDEGEDGNGRKEQEVETALREADLWPLHCPGSEPPAKWTAS